MLSIAAFVRRLFHKREAGLYVDLRRVNLEERTLSKGDVYGDVVYRNRVKQRMREGTTCALEPLYRRVVRAEHVVVPFPKQEAR